jgi:hypothetical protein
VTLPPAEESALIVNLIAATGVVKLPEVGVDDPLMLEKTVGAGAPSVTLCTTKDVASPIGP